MKSIDSYYVYVHVNKINNKRYVGITKQLPQNRWGVEGANYKNSCPHFWNAIKKYGWDNFDHIIIAEGLTKVEACEKEIQLIDIYRTQNREYGYNTLSGGTAPSIPLEIREKMSRSMMGNKNGLGHPCSDEKKKKISDAQKGKMLTDEHKANISKAKTGKSHASPSAETRQKISDSHEKSPVYCFETNTTYKSIQECARELGLYATNVCKCCKGKIRTTGGYHIRYDLQNNTINA